MQVTTLLNTIEYALESYCPWAVGPSQCEELKQMRRLLEVSSTMRLREIRAREQALEAELERQQWEGNILVQFVDPFRFFGVLISVA